MKCGYVGGREWTQAGRRTRYVCGKEGLGLPTPGGGLSGEGQWPGDCEGQSSPWGRFCFGATPQPPPQSQVQLGTSPVADAGHSHLRSSWSLPRDVRLQDSVQILLPPAHFALTFLPAAPGTVQSWTPPGRPRVVEEWTALGQSWAWFPDRGERLRVGPAAFPQEDGP